jgi:hypothetical protein
MTDFENQLRGALRREEPSAGFAERVIALSMAQAQAPKRRSGWKLWAAVAAMLVAAPLLYERYQQRRAEEARDQAILALRITAEKLNVMRDKIQGATR